MSRRYISIICVAAVVSLAVLYLYWAWDPLPVGRFVPRGAPMVLEARDLSGFLDACGYASLMSRLPDSIRATAMIPYSPIAPGLTYMDVLGSHFVVFTPGRETRDLAGSAVISARMSQKAKLAETAGSLAGRSQKISTPAGRRARMLRTELARGAVYYTRRDRTIVASLSPISLDSALGSVPTLEIGTDDSAPFLKLDLTREGVLAVLNLLAAQDLLPASGLSKKLEVSAALVDALRLAARFDGRVQLTGSLDVLGGEILEKEFRRAYRPYSPAHLEKIPGDMLFCVSTNYPQLVKDIRMGEPHIDRMFKTLADFFGDLGSFDGELTVAAVRLGEDQEYILVAATRKLLFPRQLETDMVKKIAGRMGEAFYAGELGAAPFYRVQAPGSGNNCYMWFPRGAVIATSSEAALDLVASRLQNPPGGSPFSREGDLFLIVAPSLLGGAGPVNGQGSLRDFLGVLGTLRLRFILQKGKIEFSGQMEFRTPAEI